jgi:hypothetical protein
VEYWISATSQASRILCLDYWLSLYLMYRSHYMQQSAELVCMPVLAKHARIDNLWLRVASGALGGDSKSLLLDVGDDGLCL